MLAAVHEETGGRDGFVSLEVAPDLAHDTDGTLAVRPRATGTAVDRPNVMIKIPGTAEGVDAIEQAIYEGINVNVTLLFAVEAYEAVARAYIRGLERRHAEGKSLDVNSVASFFVSRVDTLVDKQLDAIGGARGREAEGHGRARQRARRLRALQGDLQRRGVGDAGRRRRRRAASAVGLDRRQEPGLPGHQVRRPADRAPHRQHDAAGDAERGRRPRHGPRRDRRASTRPPSSTRCRPSAST